MMSAEGPPDRDILLSMNGWGLGLPVAYMRDKVCTSNITEVTILSASGERPNHTFIAWMSFSRTPLEGREHVYWKGASTT